MTTFNTIHPYTGGERIAENEVCAAADALRRSFSGDGELSDAEHFAAQALLAAVIRMVKENPNNIMGLFETVILDNLKRASLISQGVDVPPRPVRSPHWVHDGRGGHLAA